MVIPANPLLTKTTQIDVANRPPIFFDTILPELPRGPQRSQLTGVVPRFQGRQLRFDLPGSNGVTPITTFLTLGALELTHQAGFGERLSREGPDEVRRWGSAPVRE